MPPTLSLPVAEMQSGLSQEVVALVAWPVLLSEMLVLQEPASIQ